MMNVMLRQYSWGDGADVPQAGARGKIWEIRVDQDGDWYAFGSYDGFPGIWITPLRDLMEPVTTGTHTYLTTSWTVRALEEETGGTQEESPHPHNPR